MGPSARPGDRCPRCFAELTAGQPCSRCAGDGELHASPLVLPAGTLLAGQYRIGQVLGQPGGFGITYLAWDERLETRVAIKEFFPRELAGRGTDRATVQPHTRSDASLFGYGLEQFLREARTLARFDHPNIVRVRNFFEANGTGYLVMDYYEGESLSAYLARQPDGRLEEDLAVRIILPVLDGLRTVHAQGILHRDIDPHNIYLTTQGRVIVLDFGAARVAMGDRSRSLSVILKPGFAPYEQYASSGAQGAWTDVYACAATLYRMVTGQVPVDAPSRVMEDTLRPAHQVNPAVSQRLGSILEKAMALRPDARPQSADELRKLLVGKEVAPPPGRKPESEPRSKIGVKVVSGIVVLYALARLASALGGDGPTPEPRPMPTSPVVETPPLVPLQPSPAAPADPYARWTHSPLVPGAWTVVGGRERLTEEGVIREHPDFPQLGSSQTGRMRRLELSFYPGSYLYEVEVGREEDGWGVLTYIRTGSRSVVINGSADPIHQLNRQVPLQFGTAQQAADYLWFFVGGLQGEGGRFQLIRSVDDINWRNRAARDREAPAFRDQIQPVSVRRAAGGGWTGTGTVFYNGAAFVADFRIEPGGMVDMTDDTPIAADLSALRERFDARGVRIRDS